MSGEVSVLTDDQVTRDSDKGDTFDCLESVNDSCDDCVMCGHSVADTSSQLLPCLHTACTTCLMINSQIITCPRCIHTSDTCYTVTVTPAQVTDSKADVPHVSELEMARDQISETLIAAGQESLGKACHQFTNSRFWT